MSTGYVLVFAILVLGGVIATVGDRLGTRVGKARLSLFNLRPRNTAVVVTVITGTVISATTLTILFLADSQLRTGLFELGKIQDDLVASRKELEDSITEKEMVRRQLLQVKSEQKQLERDKTLTQQQLAAVSNQTKQLRTEIHRLQTSRQELVEQREQLIASSQKELSRRNQAIEELQTRSDMEITKRNQEIKRRQEQLRKLEREQQGLEDQLSILRQGILDFRQNPIAIFRGQSLASGVIRAQSETIARQAIEQLLREANRMAILYTQSPANSTGQPTEQLVQITISEVDRLIQQITSGRDSYVRIIAAGNYVWGEGAIRVVADINPYRVLYQKGETLATVPLELKVGDRPQLQLQIEKLVELTKLNARQIGYRGDQLQIGDGRLETLIRFVNNLPTKTQPIQLKSIASESIYTAGLLKIELVAIENNRVLIRTDDLPIDPISKRSIHILNPT
ncbi:MAG: DUF3084 domain-containing protein [Synechococcales cyanobacterium]